MEVREMRQAQRKLLIRSEWERWLLDHSLDPEEATSRDCLKFFYDLQGKKSPLLEFRPRGHDKWEIVHQWLLGVPPSPKKNAGKKLRLQLR
jgi:hypothetical protein